jgi:hypothetical protein
MLYGMSDRTRVVCGVVIATACALCFIYSGWMGLASHGAPVQNVVFPLMMVVLIFVSPTGVIGLLKPWSRRTGYGVSAGLISLGLVASVIDAAMHPAWLRWVFVGPVAGALILQIIGFVKEKGGSEPTASPSERDEQGAIPK